AQRLVDQLLWAAVKSHTVKVNRIGQTLLFEAAQHVSGQQAFEIGATEALLKHGAAIDARDQNGFTPIVWAAEAGKVRMMTLGLQERKHLVQKGATTDMLSNMGGDIFASATGPAVKYALELGMDPNRMLSKGQTNLFGAAKRGDVEKVKVLCETHKADFNHRDEYGQTCVSAAVDKGLFYAAAHGGLKVTDLLLVKYKADALIKDNCGRTALQYVRELQNADKHQHVVKLLADAERKQQKAIEAAQKKQRAAAARLQKQKEKLAKAQKKAEEVALFEMGEQFTLAITLATFAYINDFLNRLSVSVTFFTDLANVRFPRFLEQERARAERAAAAATRAAAASSSSRRRPSSAEEPAAKRQRYEFVCQEGRRRIPQDSEKFKQKWEEVIDKCEFLQRPNRGWTLGAGDVDSGVLKQLQKQPLAISTLAATYHMDVGWTETGFVVCGTWPLTAAIVTKA
ncbi:unnamed protein product, partial [Cladocopium goreaui]